MGSPERQCIGCGRRGEQSDLIRLAVAVDAQGKRVVASESGPRQGRGAYLCRQMVCLERALMRKAFQRAFRTSVEVDKDALEKAILESRVD